jgi:hypothetical protein
VRPGAIPVAFTATVAAVVCACSFLAPTNDADVVRYVPETADVVVSDVTPASSSYTLAGGETVSIPSDEWLSEGTADDGYLILIGSSPRRWAYAVPPSAPFTGRPDGCFSLSTTRASVTDGTIDALVRARRPTAADPSSVYLRLSLASTFAADYEANGQLAGRGTLCLNANGQATAYV